jgi:acyl transferase domain-containing protein
MTSMANRPVAVAGTVAVLPRALDGSPPTGAGTGGVLLVGGDDEREVRGRLGQILAAARAGREPPPAPPDPELAEAAVRVAVEYSDAAELAGKLVRLTIALNSGLPAALRLLRQQGTYVVRGPTPKVAFLYPGQGAQYLNMLRSLAAREPVVRATFDEADRVMTALLGQPLTPSLFTEEDRPADGDAPDDRFTRIEVTQPGVLACDIALHRLLAGYGVVPDMVMGHSFGEYAALVAAGSMTFPHALDIGTCRGIRLADAKDNGAMAAVRGDWSDIQRVIAAEAAGSVVVANVNSTSQAVIGGTTDGVTKLVERFRAAGMECFPIPVSHAFHTPVVADASASVKEFLRRLNLVPPRKPIISNLTGEFYPPDSTTETMVDMLGRHMAAPVQFVKGLRTLYESGARVFVEVGPKKALYGFVEDVLGKQHDDIVALFTNHPKLADHVGVNRALAGLYAAGVGLAGDRHRAAGPLPRITGTGGWIMRDHPAS